MTRRRTRLAAWCALLAVLLAQLATAAYACSLSDAPRTPAPAYAGSASPCADMGMADGQDRSALCVEHCKVGGQLVDNQSTGQPVAPSVLLTFCTAAAAPQPFVADDLFVDLLLARATAPPVFASSSRLRI